METGMIVREDVFLAPAAGIDTLLRAYQAKKDFIEKVLVKDVDFGPIPGSDKPALKKPGAEKMANLYGLRPDFVDIEKVEDWTGANHNGEAFFYYRQKCNLWRGGVGMGMIVASADGSCNSWEKKYRYRWVGETEIPAGMEKAKLHTRGGRISEFAFAVEKAETSGKYGKPAEYWQRFKDAIENKTATAVKKKIKDGSLKDAWEIDSTLYCIPNDDIPEQVNTILKMAQKRALIAATLIATCASDYFTQDIEDFIEGEVREVKQNAQPGMVETGKELGGKVVEETAEIIPLAAFWPVDAEISYDNAKKVKGSDKKLYIELTSKELADRITQIVSFEDSQTLTAEQKSDYKYRMNVMQTILKAQAAQAAAKVQP